VTVRAEVELELPPIRADRALLRDALANFVVNAVEAMKTAVERSSSWRLAGRSREAPRRSDSPARRRAGRPHRPPPALFEPAFSTKSRGSGMGLAATRSAVERQGGSVFAAPRPGGGSSSVSSSRPPLRYHDLHDR